MNVGHEKKTERFARLSPFLVGKHSEMGDNSSLAYRSYCVASTPHEAVEACLSFSVILLSIISVQAA
jgi:hypothetical protein